MNDENRVEPSHAGAEHPQAVVQVAPGILAKLRTLGTKIWLLTAICFVLAIVLIVTALGSRGTSIVVSFKQGHGIKPGDTLRHRGIEVGEVESVEIADDLKGVTVSIKMQEQAADLARRGSQFWIERPRVSLAGVAGLDTVVGAKYIAVQPGPDGRAARDDV